MVIVWVILVLFAIGVVVGILTLLGFGIHRNVHEQRRFRFERGRREQRSTRHTTGV